MNDIISPAKDNLILFPKTLDYYQIQLTVMLESERYGEAMDLLRFLLQCQGQEERYVDEWQALLEWLETAFPQYISGEDNEQATIDNDVELDEEDLARRNAEWKFAEDADYANKMLSIVKDEALSEQTMLALEQLSYLNGDAIDQELVEWLQSNNIHPLLQYRVLQTLHKRGMQGSITFMRGQEQVEVDIESIPTKDNDFPLTVQKIVDRVAEYTELQEPTLFYFAQELWSQFIKAVYGTNVYLSMLTEEDLVMDIWAAALHQTVSESLTGSRNEEETRAIYGITENFRFRFEQAYRVMKQFVTEGGA
ncbi:hypothetical protein ACP8HI_15670 [Paenibacillus sp. FA6]|uniref:hypothetical protein n=1 Tax=Paenibacillus sp. FA6 TaxID=3413029 RepID=UPI003F65DFEA